MRVTSLAFFVLAAVSTPIYAAPVKGPHARALHSARGDYDSEALNLSGLAKTAVKALPTIISAVPSLIGWFHHGNSTRRDFEELMLRAASDHETRAFSHIIDLTAMPVYPLWGSVKQYNPSTQQANARDFEELMLRATSDDESGAVSIGDVVHWGETLIPPVWNGVKQLIVEHKAQAQQAKTRDFVEVLARAAAEADESDALSLSSIWDVVKGGWHLLSGSGSGDQQQQQQQRREFVEVLARAAAEADESGAFSFSSLFRAAKDGWDLLTGSGSSNQQQQQQQQQQRRDLVEILARAAAAGDESDALSLSSIFHVVKDGWDLLTGSGSGNQQQQQQQRRELVEILARAAAAGDESDALSLSSIWGAVKGGWDLLTGSGSGNQQQQQQRRELVELLSRSEMVAELLSRAPLYPPFSNINWTQVASSGIVPADALINPF